MTAVPGGKWDGMWRTLNVHRDPEPEPSAVLQFGSSCCTRAGQSQKLSLKTCIVWTWEFSTWKPEKHKCTHLLRPLTYVGKGGVNVAHVCYLFNVINLCLRHAATEQQQLQCFSAAEVCCSDMQPFLETSPAGLFLETLFRNLQFSTAETHLSMLCN